MISTPIKEEHVLLYFVVVPSHLHAIVLPVLFNVTYEIAQHSALAQVLSLILHALKLDNKNPTS